PVDGRAHPERKVLMCSDLERAIALAEEEGLVPGFKPYHAKGTRHVWSNDDYVDEVMIKKIDQLLPQYDNNFVHLVTETDRDELMSPLLDNVNGLQIEVSTGRAGQKFSSSPYKILKRYIELKEIKGFEGFKPYHLNMTSMSTFSDQSIIDELLVKKIEQLLPKYDGDLTQLILETDQKELLSPLRDTLSGQEVNVSMGSVGQKLGCGPYNMVKQYIEVKNIQGYEKLRPYHFRKATSGTFSDQGLVDELLVKKIEQVLPHYDNNLVQLITETNVSDFQRPLHDTLCGRPVEVSMGAWIKIFNSNLFQMLAHYIDIEKIEGFEGFRPYHLSQASRRTFKDQSVIDELLVKKIEQLLPKYDNNLTTLITQTTKDEIRSPLQDTLNGEEIEVSMRSMVNALGHSPYNMVRRYIEVKNIQGYEKLRPYHFSQASNGTFKDQSVIDELLVKKIEQLLPKYDNNLTTLITQTILRDLQSPLQDTLNGEEIEVSMHQLVQGLGSSPFEIYEHYFKLKGMPFPYTRDCFVGSPDLRRRRIGGKLSKYDLKRIREEDKYNTSAYGFRIFKGPDKDTTREIIAEYYFDMIGEDPARYLGLESEQFSSLQEFSRLLNWDGPSATVIERDERVYNTMCSIQQGATNGLKQILNEVDIIHGDFDDEVARLMKTYNLINLDTCGHLSQDKERSVNQLFKNKRFADKSVLYVTLDNSGIGKKRAQAQGYDDQIAALDDMVHKAASTSGYSIGDKFTLSYDGGTTKRKRPMIIAGFYIERNERSDSTLFEVPSNEPEPKIMSGPLRITAKVID
ncbi:MAG: hypothetical protein ACE5FT_05135, partial [Candidatus Nanoarchaeia archaeon]